MDIVAHALWAGLGVAALTRTRPVARRDAVLTVALAALPDLAHLLPLIGAAFFTEGGWRVLWAYAVAQPSTEPVLAPAVALVAHHLHCTLHSALVAGAVTALVAWRRHAFWLPLAGWWSHIVIDVPTHSANFYPAPLLYPLTQRGFDGIAWNTPVFMLANYAALALAAAALWFTRPGRPQRSRASATH